MTRKVPRIGRTVYRDRKSRVAVPVITERAVPVTVKEVEVQ